MSVSRDVDLTHNLDFNKEEPKMVSVRLPKEVKDSYKRYNEYANIFTSTTSFSNEFYTPLANITSTVGLEPFSWNTIKVEERVCWRKLYRDPSIYSEMFTEEEYIEHVKNRNFAMGNKYDRLKIYYELLKEREGFCGGVYCDCCGKKLNLRNCLSHHYSLCSRCYDRLYNDNVDSIKL